MGGTAVEVGWKQLKQSLIAMTECIVRAMGHYWRVEARQ